MPVRIALLSNPKSTGNVSKLPRIRAFCAEHPDIFHYEVEQASQIGEAMRTLAQIRPRLLVINGGDGTVQAALTELHNGGHFGTDIPPVAVLPNGKTNLIALDLGAQGDPVTALSRLLEIARSDLSEHLVARELIALRCGAQEQRPVIGMFLGGAGLADTMLYCRNRIYPLGLPNGLSHAITAVAVLLRGLLGWKAKFLPPEPAPLQVSVAKDGKISGRFAVLAVTTLEKLLLGSELRPGTGGRLKMIAIEQKPASMLRGLRVLAGWAGQRTEFNGVHVEDADEISIEGERSSVILDGETFEARTGRPIFLTRATPLSFVRLAA
ncbi:diacylglycerol kinase family protein [Sphingomonas sp. BN140010]|uniref:Diacylglycerol kinase family protein n=1 Tax=Sphingomonas arvum TaxID=2992113 RepID=A0ABT3JGH0_9SPHN|nr:diacylglycerol kinase family protein [Sphingomonas sp. BN140010]MCW3798188.1 diacylglycerol kinase family protein [Sphingomonas sp. BN140010]